MRLFSAPFAFSIILTACSDGGSKSEDTDSGADTDEVTSIDTDSSADTDVEDTSVVADTDPSGDTDDGGSQGTPLVLANASFESQGVAAGAGVFQASGGGSINIPGWTYYLGTTYSGVGVARPTLNSFDQVEPLAAPADGNTVAYLDSREAFGAYSSDVHLVYTVPDAIASGAVVHARLAFGTRADGVSIHASVKLQIRIDGNVSAETVVTMPAAGTWTDVAADFAVPAGGGTHTLAIAAVAYQPDMSGATYFQTYIDNLRVSIE